MLKKNVSTPIRALRTFGNILFAVIFISGVLSAGISAVYATQILIGTDDHSHAKAIRLVAAIIGPGRDVKGDNVTAGTRD